MRKYVDISCHIKYMSVVNSEEPLCGFSLKFMTNETFY